MASEPDLSVIQRLIDDLESEDAFDRYQAIEDLAVLTQRRFEFRWRGAETDRAHSVERWRKWLDRERKRRQTSDVQTTIKILAEGSLGQLNQEVLQKVLKSLPPEQAKALMAQVLAKVSGVEHRQCDGCGTRPASVQVTSRQDDDTYQRRRLCEVCAGREGR